MQRKPCLLLVAMAVAACTAALTSCGGSSGPCGPELAKSSGGHWVCTFSDDFGGSSLDPAKWRTLTTASTGFSQAAGECYVDDPEHVRVAGGLLTLTATKLPAPASCGKRSSPYRSGMVISKYLFAQAYGRFEIRARLPAGRGFQPALWLYPQDLAYGDRSGEIDIAEGFGAPDVVSPHIHVHDAAGVDHPQGTDCHVDDASGRFHTYAVEWLPTSISFIYDGDTCFTVHDWNTGPPLVPPQPFDRPFFVLLQLALGYGANAPNPSTPFPGSLQIDYVRAWR